MRLIDADKLHPDRMANGTLAISQSQIANAKTVEAVPLSAIEYIEAEIEVLFADEEISVYAKSRLNGLIDRKVNEVSK